MRHVAKNHLGHRLGGNARALHGSADGDTAQIVGRQVGKSPWKLPMGVRAALTMDDGVLSGCDIQDAPWMNRCS